jgi:hypothetical protein
LLNLFKRNSSSFVSIPCLEEYLCADVGTGIQSNEKHVCVRTFYNDVWVRQRCVLSMAYLKNRE